MAASLTSWGATQLTAMLFGIVPVPSSYWLALATSTPGPGWDGTVLAAVEPPAAAGYVRQEVLTGPDGAFVSQNNYVGNDQGIAFGSPTQDWGVVTHYALLDASTGGNLYAYARVLRPVAITDQYYVQIPPGAIALTLQPFQGDPTT